MECFHRHKINKPLQHKFQELQNEKEKQDLFILMRRKKLERKIVIKIQARKNEKKTKF
jgi:ribosomal protein S9